MRRIAICQVDAFTDRPFHGNPAGVVLDASGLSAEEMLAIAREMNDSETAFVIPRAGEGYDLRVRFFTARSEVPICGHATIAAFYALARERSLADCTLVQATGAGNLPVDIAKEKDDYRITLTQDAIEFGSVFDREYVRKLADALRIDPSDLDDRAPIQIVSTGYSKVMVLLRSKDVLDALDPDGHALAALSGEIGSNGFYAFTLDSREEGILTAGRMFAPYSGVPEDPVTGNAIGPSGAYLVRYGLLRADRGSARFVAAQGEAMGRKGYVDVGVELEGGEPSRVRIAGTARIAYRAEMELP